MKHIGNVAGNRNYIVELTYDEYEALKALCAVAQGKPPVKAHISEDWAGDEVDITSLLEMIKAFAEGHYLVNTAIKELEGFRERWLGLLSPDP